VRPFVTNTVLVIHRAMAAGKEILFEGAQGTFLDIDHGTYLYVTSSNTTAGGACTGAGVPPNKIDRIVGAMKAYTTRVGEGPFPTANAVLSDLLHSTGGEFARVTGRPRRCGWFDAVATRYAALLNGIDKLAVTNLDGLDSLERVKICVAYRLDGKRIEYPPTSATALGRAQPVYIEMPGWVRPGGTADPRRAHGAAQLARPAARRNSADPSLRRLAQHRDRVRGGGGRTAAAVSHGCSRPAIPAGSDQGTRGHGRSVAAAAGGTVCAPWRRGRATRYGARLDQGAG
jgi:hypothetical protein